MITKIKVTLSVQGGFHSKRGTYRTIREIEEEFDGDLTTVLSKQELLSGIIKATEDKLHGDERIVGRSMSFWETPYEEEK